MATFYETRPEKYFIGEMTHYPFPLHVHEVVEVLCLERGSAAMTIGDTPWFLHPGDIALIFPLIPHSYERLSEDISGLIAIFPQDKIPDCASVFHTMIPVPPVLRAANANEHIRLAFSQIRKLSDPISSPLGAAYLHVLLAELMQVMPLSLLSDYDEPGLGYRIIHYVSDHACEDINLENTARALGISVSHLSHFFSQKIHVNFRRFVNALRIDKARQLMRDPNITLTDVCGLCGYANMRTFRRAFQQESGVLPSDYIFSLRAGALDNSAPEQ